MGQLTVAAQASDGGKQLAVLKDLRDSVDQLVTSVAGVAASYSDFESGLGDQADIDFAADRFDQAVAAAAASLDGLTIEGKGVVDRFFAGLGYTKTP